MLFSRQQRGQHDLHELCGLRPLSSAPHKMLVHLFSSLGGNSSTSLSFSSLKGSATVSARLRTPLALSNMWWGM